VSSANIAGYLWTAARMRGAHAALATRDESVDYDSLLGRSMSIAAVLAAEGVGADNMVGILFGPGIEAVASFFAVLSVGGVAVMLSDTLRPRQIEQALQRVGATHLVTASSLLARYDRPINSRAQVIDTESVPNGPAPRREPVRRDEDDLAQIIFTSGSSGPAKGVMITHGNLRAATSTVTDYLTIRQDDRIAGLLPLTFVYGMSQLLCSCSTGATLVIERSPLAREIVNTIQSRRLTVVAGVPTLWSRLLGQSRFADELLPDLRVMTNAGAHLPSSTVRALRRAQPDARLFLMYGMTETLRSTFLDPAEVDEHPDSIGRAIPGARIDVVRDDGTLAVAGEVGELVHRGPTVARGYWNDRSATERVFREPRFAPPGPWDQATERSAFSGDLVRRDADGRFFFVSRRDRLIKTSGFRVGPDEVAEVLHASGEVSEVIVAGEDDEERGSRIIAYVTLANGGSAQRLRAFCARELPPHLRPARIEARTALPKLPNGKFDVTTATMENENGEAEASPLLRATGRN
jgi:acyl-CoA synthetase (AMP-forming)/AMP-acid ligase II